MSDHFINQSAITKNMEDTKIQIPSSVVKNGKIKGNAFAVYYYLKYQSFRKWDDDKLNLKIDHQDLKRKLGIKDNRSIVAALKVLYTYGLIEQEITKMPIHSLLNITLVDIEAKPFTQLPIQLIEMIPAIKPNGLRLLYFYESFINRKHITKDFSYPSILTINKETGLNPDTIIKYNKILEEQKLLKVEKHLVGLDFDNKFTKYNNHYKIRLDKMQKKVN